MCIRDRVATGLQPALALQERQAPLASQPRAPQSAQLAETKKKVLSAIGGDAYKEVKNRFPNPALFEGTVPIPSSGAKGGALKGVDPSDPGVDLSSIPGMSNWGTIAANIGRKG